MICGCSPSTDGRPWVKVMVGRGVKDSSVVGRRNPADSHPFAHALDPPRCGIANSREVLRGGRAPPRSPPRLHPLFDPRCTRPYVARRQRALMPMVGFPGVLTPSLPERERARTRESIDRCRESRSFVPSGGVESRIPKGHQTSSNPLPMYARCLAMEDRGGAPLRSLPELCFTRIGRCGIAGMTHDQADRGS
jgi:hypothetical protein